MVRGSEGSRRRFRMVMPTPSTSEEKERWRETGGRQEREEKAEEFCEGGKDGLAVVLWGVEGT